jgi:hypothetical protein
LKTADRSGYPMTEFLRFYPRALDHLSTVNTGGYPMVETYGQLLLTQLMTPFSHGYVDLRSPTGAGLGAVVYDFDGRVYPSDEARMLAAIGALPKMGPAMVIMPRNGVRSDRSSVGTGALMSRHVLYGGTPSGLL